MALERGGVARENERKTVDVYDTTDGFQPTLHSCLLARDPRVLLVETSRLPDCKLVGKTCLVLARKWKTTKKKRIESSLNISLFIGPVISSPHMAGGREPLRRLQLRACKERKRRKETGLWQDT